MKIRTSIRAGGTGCSPETMNYMQKAVNMQQKVENCMAKKPYPSLPPYSGYVPPYSAPVYTGSTYSYPDMSGTCG
jgi:hypothetical protein